MTWRTPDLTDCNPGIEPSEFQVLVAMAEKPAVTSGGIMLPPSTTEREQWGSKLARLVAVSPLAFTYAEWPAHARKPQVGDEVFVGLYPGEQVEGRDGKTYRLCGDRIIGAVVNRAWADADEAPAMRDEHFDRAEVRLGETVLRPATGTFTKGAAA